MTAFEIHTRAGDSLARTGTLRLTHGAVRTPAFVPLATKAVVKTLEVQVRLVEAADLETRLGALEAHLRGQPHEKGSSQWGR